MFLVCFVDLIVRLFQWYIMEIFTILEDDDIFDKLKDALLLEALLFLMPLNINY